MLREDPSADDFFNFSLVERFRNDANFHLENSDVLEFPLEQSVHTPRAISLPTGLAYRNKLELSLFDKDLFVNGYFFSSGVQNPGSTRSLTKSQPWLQWDESGGIYLIIKTGAQDALLKKLLATPGDLLTVYRGIPTDAEWSLWQARRNAARGNDAIFTTTSLAVARSWGKTAVIEFQIPKSLLARWSNAGDIYIGVEGTSGAELGFISPEAQKFLMRNWKVQDPNFRWFSPRSRDYEP